MLRGVIQGAVLSENTKRIYSLGDLHVDGRIIAKYGLKRYM
jgi:hypothetical protein